MPHAPESEQCGRIQRWLEYQLARGGRQEFDLGWRLGASPPSLVASGRFTHIQEVERYLHFVHAVRRNTLLSVRTDMLLQTRADGDTLIIHLFDLTADRPLPVESPDLLAEIRIRQAVQPRRLSDHGGAAC